MNFQDKSKEELLNELHELHQKYNSVVALYEKKIEENKLTEQNLHENQANIKAIIENSLESIWSIDTNYNIQYVNEVFAKSFQQTFDVRLEKGTNILESLPLNLKTIWKERYDRAFQNEHFVFTDKIDLENGSVYIEVAMNPVIINNKVVGASFFGKDISERMHSAEALLESETRFKALHNSSFGGIVIHDKGLILDCNQGLSVITGYSFDELIGMDGSMLIAEKSREFVVNNVLTGSEKPYEAIGVRKNGEEYHIRLESRNIPYKGKIVRTTELRDITEQKKAEDTLRTSEERLKILFNYAPEAYYLSDPLGNFVDGNFAAEKLLGFDKNEIIGKNIFKLNLLPAKDLLKAARLIRLSLAGKPTGPDEFVLIKKDETNVTVEITTHPVTIEGQMLILGIARDISERKRAEKSMQQASENWNRTFQAMHSGIALLDDKQKIIQTNRAFHCFVKANEKDLRGKNSFSLIFGNESTFENNPFIRMKKSKACEKTEINIGGRFFEILVDPIFDSVGRITGAVQIMNDITQRKRDESIQHILYEITSTSMVEKSIGELLVIVRKELSKVIDTNNFFVALYQPETGTLRKVIFEDEKDDFVEWDARKSLSGQILKLQKPILLKSDEETRFAIENNIELLGSPAACWLGVPLMTDEKAIGVMVVQSYTDENAYDVAAQRLLVLIAHELSIVIERKKMIQDLVAAKEKAEESDRLKSAFLANMSHEIRTPMNGILGFAELLKEPILSGEEQHLVIDIIEKSGQRMLNIINDLISISKIESGQMEVNLSETNINEQFDFLYNFFQTNAEQKKLQLIVNCPNTSFKSVINTDSEKLYAILTNLVNNAIKFTSVGNVEFGYQVKENKLLFYVKDTGIGIPKDKQKTIFERFIQVNSDKSANYEGTGLGLAISKAFVEMLGGEIWIESEEGKGTCFYFTIPLI
jgi:PAS domain S-box-containing protein